jgi:single-strand DNA-binding protein
MNHVFLLGNLTRDPEVRYLPSGTPVATFDLAVNERYRDRNQELREETLFIRVETFQRQAETCAQYLKKGSRVLVEGKLRMDSWEAKDGTKRSRILVRGLQVTFLDSRPGADQQAGGGTEPSRRPAPAAPQRQQPVQAAAGQSASDGIPEVDINEELPSQDDQKSTDDDLPF